MYTLHTPLNIDHCYNNKAFLYCEESLARGGGYEPELCMVNHKGRSRLDIQRTAWVPTLFRVQLSKGCWRSWGQFKYSSKKNEGIWTTYKWSVLQYYRPRAGSSCFSNKEAIVIIASTAPRRRFLALWKLSSSPSLHACLVHMCNNVSNYEAASLKFNTNATTLLNQERHH